MWFILVIVLVVVAFIVLKARGKKDNKKTRELAREHKKQLIEKNRRPPEEPKGQYHAISVCCEDHACQAVQDIHDKRFLATEAPTLPLSDCDQANCQCHYEHHDDRRNDEGDRRLTFGICQDLHGVNDGERREKKRDRRKKE